MQRLPVLASGDRTVILNPDHVPGLCDDAVLDLDRLVGLVRVREGAKHAVAIVGVQHP